MNSRTTTTKPIPLDLALQGGGSHGAFTWGVLDRLLDEPQISFDGVSGTSAGALGGYVSPESPQRGLRTCCAALSQAGGQHRRIQGACFGQWLHAPGAGLAQFNLDSNPFFAWGNLFLRSFSPTQLNPSGDNPLRKVLLNHVRPAALKNGPLQLFITATSVRTGQPRIFERHDFERKDVTLDALLASACLPQLFAPVVIDGEPYWDGGYTGNPAIWPLIYNTRALDIMLVKINPLQRPDTPSTAEEIADRVNEITFNAGLIAEMRAIDFVRRLIDKGQLSPGDYKHLRLHMVADDAGLAPLHASSKLNTSLEFLEALHALGRAAAQNWLLAHRKDLGKKSTLDVRSTFLQPPPRA
jgi:NTE family protein